MIEIKKWKIPNNNISNMLCYLKPFKFYVYIVVSPSDNIVYIGKGTKTRCLHTLSGVSSNYFLNKDHFNGVVNTLYIYDIFDDEQTALNVEELLQNYYNPIYCILPKKQHNNSLAGKSQSVISEYGPKFIKFRPKIKISKDIKIPEFLEENLSSSYRVLLANLKSNEYVLFPKSKYSTDSLLGKDKRKYTVNLYRIWTIIGILEELGIVEVGYYKKFPFVKLLE